jgi:hypothetical protein
VNAITFCVARARHAQGLEVPADYGETWEPARSTKAPRAPRPPKASPHIPIVDPEDRLASRDDRIIRILRMLPNNLSVREMVGAVRARVHDGRMRLSVKFQDYSNGDKQQKTNEKEKANCANLLFLEWGAEFGVEPDGTSSIATTRAKAKLQRLRADEEHLLAQLQDARQGKPVESEQAEARSATGL